MGSTTLRSRCSHSGRFTDCKGRAQDGDVGGALVAAIYFASFYYNRAGALAESQLGPRTPSAR